MEVCSSLQLDIVPYIANNYSRHVIRDLRPYVCTYPICDVASRLYESRRAWFNHEQESHRREWVCNLCNPVMFLGSREALKEHVDAMHPRTDVLVDITVALGNQASTSDEACNICGVVCSSRSLARHAGRHMEELSLFVTRQWWDSGDLEDLDDELAVGPDEVDSKLSKKPNSDETDSNSMADSRSVTSSPEVQTDANRNNSRWRQYQVGQDPENAKSGEEDLASESIKAIETAISKLELFTNNTEQCIQLMESSGEIMISSAWDLYVGIIGGV